MEYKLYRVRDVKMIEREYVVYNKILESKNKQAHTMELIDKKFPMEKIIILLYILRDCYGLIKSRGSTEENTIWYIED